jgi:hypothetical protein
VSSRLEDTWLKSAINKRLELGGLDTPHMVTIGQRLLKRQAPSCDLSTLENDIYLQHLANLVQGNPLAIRLLIDDFTNQPASPPPVSLRDYFLSLLQFRPLLLDIETLKNDRGARSVIQLVSFFEAHVTQQRDPTELWESTGSHSKHMMAASLMAFWQHLPGEMEPFVSALNALVTARSYLKEANFWNFRRRLRNVTLGGAAEGLAVSTILAQSAENPNGLAFNPNLAAAYSNAAQNAYICLKSLLSDDFGDFVGDPREREFGQEDSSYTRSYHTISPLLTIVAASSKVRESCLKDFAEDMEVARAVFYDYNDREWERVGMLPSTPGHQAVVQELQFTFFNFVSLNLSVQKIGAWPIPRDWLSQFAIADVAFLHNKLLGLVEHILQRFIVIGVARLKILRARYYLADLRKYNDNTILANADDWVEACGLEMALTGALVRIMICHDMELRPKTHCIEFWEFLVQDPMFVYYEAQLDINVYKMLLLSHSTNSKLLQWEQSQLILGGDISAFEEVANSTDDFRRGIADFAGGQASMVVAEEADRIYERFVQNMLAAGGLQDSPLGRIEMIVIDALKTTEEAKVGISKLEALLQEEVEGSNLPRTRHSLHTVLAELHKRIGNSALAAQHIASSTEAGLLLEPNLLLRLKQVQNGWRIYTRKRRIASTNPKTRSD